MAAVILVTGGTGFVGRHLVAELCRRGHAVRVLTRDGARARGLWGGAVQALSGDVLEPATLGPAVAGVEVVVHLAAALPGSSVSTDRLQDTNVIGTANLASAAAVAQVRHFVHGSSAGVYGDGCGEAPRAEDAPLAASSPYERSKLEAERRLRTAVSGSGTGLTVLRVAGVYGPGRAATLQFYRQVLRRPLWLHGPTRVIVHPTCVLDVVQAMVRVIECREAVGLTFNIAGDRPIAYPALIDLTGRLLARHVRQIALPAWVGQAAARAAAGPWPSGAAPRWLVRLGTPLVNRSLDISLARQVLGFAPLPLDEAVADTIACFRQSGQL